MTNLDAVNAVVGFTLPDPNIALKPLMDLQLSATETYNPTPENQALVDRAAIRVLTALKLLAKLDEGGFGVTFNTAAADRTITFLYKKSGDPSDVDPDTGLNEQPNIYNATNLW